MKYDAITIGNVALDIFFTIPQKRKEGFCFPLGEKIEIEETYKELGGCAANVAVGLSRLSLKAGCLTYLGKDYLSREIIEELKNENVETGLIKRSAKTGPGISCIFLSSLGERTILIHHGISDHKIIEIPRALKTEYIFLAPLGKGWESVYQQALALSCEKNIKLAINPGNLQLANSGAKIRGILRNTQILFLNKKEAGMLARPPMTVKIEELLKSVKKMGPEIVVITNGASGADVYDGEKFYHLPSSVHQRVDATGAGDAFASGFLAKIILGGTAENALKWGIENSGSVVGAIGAQTGLKYLNEL